MRESDRVRVQLAEGGAPKFCRVEAIAAGGEVPNLPGFPAEQVRGILKEWGVSRVAMLSYGYRGRRYIFAALEIGGRWWDLSRAELKISHIGTDRPN